MSETNHIPPPGTRPLDHPIAALFPMMEAPELAELTADVKKNGLREKLILHEGKILDGRNRWGACTAAKIEVEWEFFDPRRHGPSPLAFVLSKNLRRRHLNASQRAAIAAEALPMFEAEAKTRQKGSGKAHAANLRASDRFPSATPVLPPRPSIAAERTIEASPSAPQKPLFDELDQRTPESEQVGKEEAKAKAPRAPRKPSTRPARANPEASARAEAAKGKATDAAGKATGVSGRSVAAAKKLGQQAPAKLAEVKAGTKSLAKASKEAAMESTAVQDALGRIQAVCGKAQADAIREGTRLKNNAKEILLYAAQTDDVMLRIRGLIDSDWPVKKALDFKIRGVAATSKVRDLLDRAAASGGRFILEIEGWKITVEKG